MCCCVPTCESVCVCVCLCVFMCIYVCLRVCLSVLMCMSVCVCFNVCVGVHLCVYFFDWVFVCMSPCMCVWVIVTHSIMYIVNINRCSYNVYNNGYNWNYPYHELKIIMFQLNSLSCFTPRFKLSSVVSSRWSIGPRTVKYSFCTQNTHLYIVLNFLITSLCVCACVCKHNIATSVCDVYEHIYI